MKNGAARQARNAHRHETNLLGLNFHWAKHSTRVSALVPTLQPVPLGEILIVKVNGEWCVRWVRCYSPDTHIHPSVWSRNFTARVNETGLAGDGINGVRDARRNVSVTVRQYIQGGVCKHIKHIIGGISSWTVHIATTSHASHGDEWVLSVSVSPNRSEERRVGKECRSRW